MSELSTPEKEVEISAVSDAVYNKISNLEHENIFKDWGKSCLFNF